jgi:phosphoribosylanthranilate isomerase
VAAVKFCGLRRPEDSKAAVALGADYVGVIFAGGPRLVSIPEALAVLAPTRGRALAVGVFGVLAPDAIGRIVNEASLDIIQLSAHPDASAVSELRRFTSADIWATVHCTSFLPPSAAELFDVADAVHLDARVDGMLGGTGRALPWDELAAALSDARGARGKLVLSGGLTPENVRQAIAALTPDVVDVSSGVESAPGIKDHERMRAFYHEAR